MNLTHEQEEVAKAISKLPVNCSIEDIARLTIAIGVALCNPGEHFRKFVEVATGHKKD